MFMEGACCEELPGKAGMRAYDALEARAGELLGAVNAHGLEPAAPEDPATPEDPPAPPDPVRDVAFGYGDDGGWWSRINLPPEEGALFEAALTGARDDLFDHGRGAPTTWADALLHLTGIGLDRLDTATDGRLPSERHQVIIHIDGEDPDGNSRIHLGPMLSTSMRRYLACDCTLTWILERNGQPVAKGRRTRVIDPLLRTLIEDRDQTCVIPGCTQRRWLHCHHLRHWEDGGPTDPDNLIALCPRHHRAHHTGRLQLLGAPGNLRFLHADGKPLEPLRTTAPEVPLPPAPAGPYTGPHAGQRLRIGSPLGWDISPPPPPTPTPSTDPDPLADAAAA
jgi:hypothetical protein